jgi:hypothetical protein
MISLGQRAADLERQGSVHMTREHRSELYARGMNSYAYLIVTVQHDAREVNISGEGPAPRDVPGGYYRLVEVFNELGADGWELRSSVHERIAMPDGEARSFTLHAFCRQS